MRLIVLFLTLGSSLVLGWNDFAHGLMAAMTRAELKEKNWRVSKDVEKILLYISNGTYPGTKTYYESACWANDNRDRIGYWSQENWHYINQPILDKVKTHLPVSKPNIETVLNQLEIILRTQPINYNKTKKQQILTDPTLERSMSMRFLFHFVADVHQPTHVAVLYSAAHPNGDDNGGNFTLQYGDRNISLHDFWETGGLHFPQIQRPWNKTVYEQLEKTAKNALKVFPRSLFTKELTKTRPREWIEEIFEQAKHDVYDPLIRYNTSTVFYEYRRDVYHLSLRNLALSSYRLADKLIEIYEEQSNRKRENLNYYESGLIILEQGSSRLEALIALFVVAFFLTF